MSASAATSEEPDNFVPYYDQLDANGKAIFDALESADAEAHEITVGLPVILTAKANDPHTAEEYVRNLLRTTIDDAFDALRLSSPMAYWGWTVSTVPYPTADLTITGNTATVTEIYFQIRLDQYPPDPETGVFGGIQKMLDDLNAALEKFSTDGKTVRDKVEDINNYLVNLVTYDPNWESEEKSRYAHDAYGALVDPKHYAVCDGYSEAFLLLCQKEGIECVIVYGTAISNMENHAWNYVKMDNGKWYAVDVTWNDGSNNAYLLKGGDTFFYTHHQGVYLKSGWIPYPFISPVLSDTAYDHTPVAWYGNYSWLLAVVIVALISAVLYKYSRGNK
ncbi:MAG: hypothetical protein LBH88_02935 [Candidatus Methanoplasma sp.]|nr:hypothetical protein [Candidatus Methanoplasma sp.]